MTRNALLAALAAFLPAAAIAQTAPKAEFEVASIRPANPEDAKVEVGMHIDGSQVRFSYLSVHETAAIAWKLKPYQVVGPPWITTDRFNINAKLPAGSKQDQVREMLQTLLISRFKMAYHMDKKEFAVYALVPGKSGLKLKETPADPAGTPAPSAAPLDIKAQGSAAGVYADLGGGSFYSFANNKLIGHKITLKVFADLISRYMDKPVVDMTGAPEDKQYEFEFEITPEDYRTMLIRAALSSGVTIPAEAARLAEGTTDSLYSAMELTGLRMETRKTPQDVLVIDSAQKTPTAN